MGSRQINNSARDIKRVDLIVKKCDELKSLGVPAAVVYSTSKTNVIYIVGDPRITKVIEEHKDEILLNPEWMEDDAETSYTAKVMLPLLPAELSMLNGLTMKSLIRGVMKDLKLTWKSNKPVWWPSHIPFGNVTSAPENYEGTCTHFYYHNIILPMNTMFCLLQAIGVMD